MEVLAARLKWLRENKRLAQKEVASNIGVTLSGYQKMEYGQANPKIETLVQIAKYFRVTSDFLLGLTDIVDDLGIIQDDFYKLRAQKVMKSKELEVTNYQLYEIMAKLVLPDNQNNNELEMMQNMLRGRKDKLENDLYVAQEEYRHTIFRFIELLLEIPESNPFNNPIIKMISPFNIEIQPSIFDEFSLAIFCKEGFIGNYGVYKNEEEALELRKLLLTMLNTKKE
jgi:transcriptional regulator with XRE-family HTH domain